MKIKHLLFGLFAVAAAVACEPEVEVTPVLNVDKESVALEATAAEATFAVTSNQSWTATADQDWVTLEPASGEASDKAVTVKVTAEDNTVEEARTATVTVTAGELTKTVAVSQAAAEGGEEPGPGTEPEPTPEVDWTAEDVASYDVPEDAGYQVLTNVKYVVDENYLHVKIQASAAKLAETETEKLGVFIYDVTTATPTEGNTLNNGNWGWWNNACGTNEYDGESAGVITGTDLTLIVNETEVPVEKEEEGDNVVWAFSIPRTAHANLQADYFSFAFLTYKGWDATGALPAHNADMFAYGEAPAGPGTEPEFEYTLDGKQWVVETEESAVLLDFGLSEEGMLCVAVPSMDGTVFSLYMAGVYEITPTDGTSGVIVYTPYDWEWDEFGDPVEIPYSELGETSVNIAWEGVFGVTDPVTFSLAEEFYEIEAGGGEIEDPVGPIENGEYWFFNGEKVMAPLAEDATSGALPAGNVINGASTVKNIFTLTYDPDMSYYTIQDSYGRYIGHMDCESGNFVTTANLPSGEDYAYYLWCVDKNFTDGTYDIYNAVTYYGFAYSADDDKWHADGMSYQTDGVRPTLVLAENPVEEEEEPVDPDPAGPKVVTVAEFLEAAEDDTVYELTGTISRIQTAYSSQYGNISFYLKDATGEVLIYRMDCTDVADPTSLTVGDEITVQGVRSSYNSAAQMGQGCKYISHVDKEAPVVGAQKVTVAEFVAAAEDDTLYELTGTISSIKTAYSSQYGNISFFLKDATGEVQIYRMDCTGVADPTSLTVGDEITVQGYRSSCSGAAQMGQGGKYVSHVDQAEPEPEPTPVGTVVFDYTSVSTSDQSYTGETVDGVTLSGYRIATNQSGQLRLYKPDNGDNAYIILNSGDKKMTRIELTFVSDKYVGKIEAEGYSNGVWTGNASEVKLVNTGGVEQARITKITITLE